MTEAEVAELEGGRLLVGLNHEHPTLALVVLGPDGEVARVELPVPNEGYGGHVIVVSPRETFIAVVLRSGQCDVGYELFRLQPRLRHVSSLPYVWGIGEVLAFAPDEGAVVFATGTNPEFGTEEAESAERVVDWAEVRVQTLPDGLASVCSVRVRLAGGYEGEDPFYPEDLRFGRGGDLVLGLPWGGDVHLAIPLPAEVTVAGPRVV